jgi:pimeloyl-ACP methyl ester carboxylesterase
MKYCKYNNKQIAYTIQGQGPCLILLHGFPMDSRVWDGFVPELAKQFTVITIDLPGFGASECLAEKHDMSLMAETVKAVLIHESIKECVLAGHSMGGYTGLSFANQFPEMLQGLVLFHSQAASDDEQGKQARNETIERIKQDKVEFVNAFIASLFDPDFAQKQPTLVEHFRQIAAEQTVEAITAAMAGLRDRANHINLLTQLKIPVLFILGKSDSRMPITKIMAQAGLPAHAELLLLGNVGHMGFAEKPELTRKVLGDFAGRCF